MSDGPTKPISMSLSDMTAITTDAVKSAMQYIYFLPPTPWPWSMPSPDLGPKETVLGYVEAWRWWPLRKIYHAPTPRAGEPYEWLPFAANYDRPWSWSRENVADKPPAADNSNGFYAYTLEGIKDHEDCPLFGRVALYGDVIHCKYGYRAEKARILDVWIDKDWIGLYPDIWDEIRCIPQVKGVYDTRDASIYNASGERENYQCLILEHQKELSGTSLSDGRMTNRLSAPSSSQSSNQTMLIIDRRSNGQNVRRKMYTCALGDTVTEMTPMPTRIGVLSGIGRIWVVKPDGPVCDLCGRLIAKDERVAVSFEFPDDYFHKIHDRTFEWIQKQTHMECLCASMSKPPLFAAMESSATGYFTKGTI